MDNFPHGFKGIKKVVIALLLSYIFTIFAVYEWKITICQTTKNKIFNYL